jgi:2,4-dienoyl-CoA reductase-like NADH-dependent reductase (Old Yellow Enzyme family)
LEARLAVVFPEKEVEQMSIMFEPFNLCGMKLRNRFVRSATWEGMAEEDGTCTEALVGLMKRLAEGEVGLIITSHAYVRKDGQAGPRQLAIYDDKFIPALSRMVKEVHGSGGKIVAQIAHAGLFANPKLSGVPPVCLSNIGGYGETQRHEMSSDELSAIADDYAMAALRARRAGFDGIQIHAAHGYLLSQSLSPRFNQRKDRYGGDLEGRARLLLQVIKLTRERAGKDFPVLIKMNSSDYLENGLEREDAIKIAALASESGVCAVEVSGGTVVSGELSPSRLKILSQDREAYFREASRAFKERIPVPVILVGGIRSFDLAERLVLEKVCDLISLCRPLIREPELISRWRAGDRRKAACLSDNLCFGPARAGEGIYCVVERRSQEK